jgi:hypothetical protein
MAKFYMFYGVQVCEFERPAIVAKPGKAKIAGIKHRLKIKPTTTKVVIKNDFHNQAK